MVNILSLTGHVASVTAARSAAVAPSSHRQRANEWWWPCFQSISFTATRSGPDLTSGLMASQLPPEQSLTNEEGRLIANSGGKIFKSAHVTLKDGKRETKNRRDECQGSRFKRNNIDNYLK